MCAPTLCRFSRAYKLLCSKCFFLTKQSNVFLSTFNFVTFEAYRKSCHCNYFWQFLLWACSQTATRRIMTCHNCTGGAHSLHINIIKVTNGDFGAVTSRNEQKSSKRLIAVTGAHSSDYIYKGQL